MHFSVDAIGDASMVQRLDNGEVSVGQAYVFACLLYTSDAADD